MKEEVGKIFPPLFAMFRSRMGFSLPGALVTSEDADH